MNYLAGIAIAFTLVASTHGYASGPELHSMTVLQTDSSLESVYTKMISDFHKEGPNAVAAGVLQSLANPEFNQAWKESLASTGVKVIQVDVHPNQKASVEWMNKRFKRMGIPKLQFEAQFNTELPDKTLKESDIKVTKWLRYTAGPGIAMVASYMALPALGAGTTVADYGLLVLPAAGLAVTTVLLEFQFAHPYLNDHFWKKVWEFGGPITGRVTNIFVNFLYGMALYGGSILGAHVPELFGHAAVAFEHLGFASQVVSAFIGGLIFHVAMGQYQTDIALQQTQGNMLAKERYGRETTGVIINGGARIVKSMAPSLEKGLANINMAPSTHAWMSPALDSIGYIAQGTFFLFKTAPNFWKTYVKPFRMDSAIQWKIDQLRQENQEITSMSSCIESLNH